MMNLRIYRGTPHRTVGISQSFPHKSKIHATVEAFQKMVLGDLLLQPKVIVCYVYCWWVICTESPANDA
jgi:hypothetical protein